jgi:transposase
MLRWEEDVEAHALYRRGWTISAIARHLGRDRKTVRAYVLGERTPGKRRRAAADPFERFSGYAQARLQEDPHLWGTALYDEVVALGYERSYPSFTRVLRARRLRPPCLACAGVKGRETVELDHPPGEELQLDWLELGPTPWGEPGLLLVGVLPASGRIRAVFADGEDQAHLVEALDAVLRRLGGTPLRWRIDRMASAVDTRSGALLASFTQVAKYYAVAVAVCPPRRPQRKGAVEAANRFIAGRWWRTVRAGSREQAQAALDRFLATVGDDRRRGGRSVRALAAEEPLRPLPPEPYPATLEVERPVGASALVAFRGNRYSLPPGLAGARVRICLRLDSDRLRVVSEQGLLLAEHALAPAGGGRLVRSAEHARALEQAVLAALSDERPCRRKANRPPGPAAEQERARLRPPAPGEVVRVDLARYARLAEVAR